jgi:hypothetical protein
MNEVTPADVKKCAGFDWPSAVMATVAIAALLAAAWFRSGSTTKVKSISVGESAPLLRLTDLDSGEPLVMLGLKGKVVWLVFWSAGARDAPQSLAAIARASSKLRSHRRFAILTAAAEADNPGRVRAALAESQSDLPAYLASADNRLRFGAENADPPLHVLIDAEGQVLTIARGTSQSTLDRIADQARRHLDELAPADNTRFASRSPR